MMRNYIAAATDLSIDALSSFTVTDEKAAPLRDN